VVRTLQECDPFGSCGAIFNTAVHRRKILVTAVRKSESGNCFSTFWSSHFRLH
jgi:hypothetical protein